MPDQSLEAFAIAYTAAWCSQQPGQVAAHYSPEGTLTINGGPPAVGRTAITEAAQSFMTAFPDLQVIFDQLSLDGPQPIYHWTLIGTNTGPGGTGRRVKISGYESWQMGTDGLISASLGHFDAAEYARQLTDGPSIE